MSFLLAAVAPPCFAVIQSAAGQPRRGRNSKNTQKSKQNGKTSKPSTAVTSTTSNPSGFGGKGKNPVWQCVQNCGACCKLDKGPDFPSAEEIFDDPSDIQVCSLTCIYSPTYGCIYVYAVQWMDFGNISCIKAWWVQMVGAYTMRRAQESVLFMLVSVCCFFLCVSFWILFSDWGFVVVERPYFCRVEPEIFETLYGIDKKKFNKEACRSYILFSFRDKAWW